MTEMSIECKFELECLGKVARSFFRMANEEIFRQQKEFAELKRELLGD